MYSEDTFDDLQGVGRVSFHCPLSLFPALMLHPPWGRELLRFLPNRFNYDVFKKKIRPVAEIRKHQVSDRRQPTSAPVAVPTSAPVAMPTSAPVATPVVCSVFTCILLQCSVMAFPFFFRVKSLSINFFGLPIFPGSLVLLGPGHALWICFHL